MFRCRFSVSVAALLVLSAGAAYASRPIEVVYAADAHAPSSPKADVPGIPGARFNNFLRLSRSPTTNLWNATPSIIPNSGTAADQVHLVGSGVTGVITAQEGVDEVAPAEPFVLGITQPRINDAGSWAHVFGDHAVRFNNTLMPPAFDINIRTNDPVPSIPGASYSGAFSAQNIQNNGAIGFLAGLLNGPGSEAAFTDSGATVKTIVGQSIPTGQAGDAMNAWADIDDGEFYVDAAGANWIARGELATDAASDKVAVRNNAVVLQEGSVLAGSSFSSPASASNLNVYMEPDGTWFLEGQNADGVNWMARNGVVIAVEGQPVAPGSTLNWTSFDAARGNNRGDWVILGDTDGPTTSDWVVVHFSAPTNRTRILVREADPIDLDNDGVADAGLFLGQLTDRLTLNNDNHFYFAAPLKNAPDGANIGNNSSLMRVSLCVSNFNGDGAVDASDIFIFLDAWFTQNGQSGPDLSADVNGSGNVDATDIFVFLDGWFAENGFAC